MAWNDTTVEFCRLGQFFIDLATAVVGEADRELTCVTHIYHSSDPIYETSAQSTEFACLPDAIKRNAKNVMLHLYEGKTYLSIKYRWLLEFSPPL